MTTTATRRRKAPAKPVLPDSVTDLEVKVREYRSDVASLVAEVFLWRAEAERAQGDVVACLDEIVRLKELVEMLTDQIQRDQDRAHEARKDSEG